MAFYFGFIKLYLIPLSSTEDISEDYFTMNKKNISEKVKEEIHNNKITFKKLLISILLFFLGIFVTIQFSNIFMDSKYVGREKIKENVVFHANTDYEDIEEYRCEIDINEDGVVVYTAFCSTPKGVYNFTFDAKSGDLLKYNYAEYGQQLTEENIS